MDFSIVAGHRVKIKQGKKKSKYVDFASELKKSMEPEDDGDTNNNWYAWNNL